MATPAPRPAPGSAPATQTVSGLELTAVPGSAAHGHGGDSAGIGYVELDARKLDRKGHVVAARSLVLLRSACSSTGWDSQIPLELVGLAAAPTSGGRDLRGEARTITIPAGSLASYRLRFAFTPVDVYQACDRFALAVELAVDGTWVRVDVPLEVIRYEPVQDGEP